VIRSIDFYRLPDYIIVFHFYYHQFMIRNYFKIAWRNLLRNKLYSVINIAGLAVGMAVALLIALWIANEYSYDKFLPDYKQLYCLRMNATLPLEGTKTQDQSSLPLAELFRKNYPEIKYVAESGGIYSYTLAVGDKKIELDGTMIGSDFLKMFQYPLIAGHASTVLKDPYSIVLTESAAKALFGNTNPMNQIVKMDNKHDLKVTGILKDLPVNSSLQFSFLVPFSFLEQTNKWVADSRSTWFNFSFYMYVQLQPNALYTNLEPRIKNLITVNCPETLPYKAALFLHPLADWRLRSEFRNGRSVGGYIDYVYIFGCVGILVLLIACINFMNLSTARSQKRGKEVGIRKTIGSQRKQLIMQFLFESVFIAFIAFVFSQLLVQLSLPSFNLLTGSSIQIPFSAGAFWASMLGYVLFTGFIAGIRPAFYLSSFNVVQVLKGTIQSTQVATWSRKSLVIFQFSCSVALIISTLIIYKQIQYAKERPVGYDRNRLMITLMNDDLRKNYTALKNELLQTGMVASVATANYSITSHLMSHDVLEDWPNKAASEGGGINIGFSAVSENYFQTVGMEIVKGRNFSGVADTLSAIVNEAAISGMGLKDPINKIISLSISKKFIIVGVVKDVVLGSPFEPVLPMLFTFQEHSSTANLMVYRLSSSIKTADAIAAISKKFENHSPAFPYTYEFVDENYAAKFKLESLVASLAGIFAGLAIFISCLGLFGLAAYTAEQRIKEIGIRKVVGASVTQLWLLICKDFMILVVISCIIASPLAFYFLQNWLQKYDYRISICPDVFIVAAVAALIITIVTISFQAIKAAKANPVKNLRTE
jgi:putative ABC transport system permease protein